MVPEGVDDGEGDIIAAVRAAVGPSVPIAVALGFHTNLTRAMVEGRTCSTATRHTPTWTWPSAVSRPPSGLPT